MLWYFFKQGRPNACVRSPCIRWLTGFLSINNKCSSNFIDRVSHFGDGSAIHDVETFDSVYHRLHLQKTKVKHSDLFHWIKFYFFLLSCTNCIKITLPLDMLAVKHTDFPLYLFSDNVLIFAAHGKIISAQIDSLSIIIQWSLHNQSWRYHDYSKLSLHIK